MELRIYTLASSDALRLYTTQFWPRHIESLRKCAATIHGVWIDAGADGTAGVQAAGGPVDCVITADTVTYLLVMYGRLPLGRALLHGGIFTKGRRPWLALRFKNLFFNP